MHASVPIVEHVITIHHLTIICRCMYTLTPDRQPVMDWVLPNVLVGCGYSGSGFKHAPASGAMLASLALKRETELPAGLRQLLPKYKLARFTDHSSHARL